MASLPGCNNYCVCVALLLLCALVCRAASRTVSHVVEVESVEPHAESMEERHQRWMAQHGRSYTDDAEKQRRLAIFKSNVEYIESFNKVEGRQYKLGINEFADLTKEEFRARYLMGSKAMPRSPVPALDQREPFFYGNVTVEGLPSEKDWRKQGAVTGVKDQYGTCGSCWAFASVAAMEGAVKIKRGNLVSFSEQELVDCATSYGNGGCNGGFMNSAYIYIVQRGGLASERDYPYEGAQGTCKAWDVPRAERIVSFGYVRQNDEQALLEAVARQPVAVGFDAHDDGFAYYESGIYAGPCGTEWSHSLAIVGYGTTSDGTKYWLAKNSWGGSWGEGGFVRIKRDIDDVQGMCGLAMLPIYPIA
ncbi:hypothetical protein Taro_046423 [Colocasia esculenta]|uniref:Uncharacterized protein n=1 Tax=Colocasia esculenta TaxID=4460 RepID=A0A843X445_COLES|nr:hypothetical protein [Colocasia esculenta]